MFHYTGEKQDTYVSVNDRVGNFFSGLRGERAWLLGAAAAGLQAAATGVSSGGTLAAAAAGGLLAHLFNYRFFKGKSVPTTA